MENEDNGGNFFSTITNHSSLFYFPILKITISVSCLNHNLHNGKENENGIILHIKLQNSILVMLEPKDLPNKLLAVCCPLSPRLLRILVKKCCPLFGTSVLAVKRLK